MPSKVAKASLRSALVRKRDDKEDTSPAPEKRAKVTFDSDVKTNVVGRWEKPVELIQQEVRHALGDDSAADNSSYTQVKDVYARNAASEDEPSSGTLQKYTMALMNNVSSLSKSRSELVFAILNSQWLGRQQEYVALYVRFLANLASAQGVFLTDTFRMLVENLTAGKSSSALNSHPYLTSSQAPPSNHRIHNLPSVSRSEAHLRIHKALQYLLQVIPSASCVLSSIIAGTFPHETDSKRALVVYARNMLKIATYAPELQHRVLALITERLIKIDVQVQVDLEDLAEDVGDGLVQDIPRIKSGFDEDMDDSESSDNESVASDESYDEDAQRTKDITKNVEKMDNILDLLFEHYTQMVSRTTQGSQFGAFEILLSQFVDIILPTHRSRHTQFLLFHFAQVTPASVDIFVGTCMQVAFDKAQSAVVRQAAIAYLASFVARGAHVPSSIVRDVFDYIGAELERLRFQFEPTCRGPDIRRYSTFYSLVQALLYIFCFRWRDLESGQYEDSDNEGLADIYDEEHHFSIAIRETLSVNIFSKLNPLKVCSPAIVTEFARIGNHLKAVYVYHLLEANKRIRLPHFASSTRSSGTIYNHPERETALSARKDDSHQFLDEYFPFDPYHLPKSKHWIEGDYREWAGIPGLDDEKVAESESEEEGGESEAEDADDTDETGES